MKKLILTGTIAAALCIGCLTGCGVENKDDDKGAALEAASVFTIDVNPGVRVYVDADEKVIEVEATNDDGEELVASIEVKGDSYDAAVEEIIDEAVEQGYATEEDVSVLVTVEKEIEEELGKLSSKIDERINRAFEKHGKQAHVIEQHLKNIDEKLDRELDRISEKYNISEGKANLIESIREEFPELTEEELAKLPVKDLGLILDGASEDIKGKFKKIDAAVNELYAGAEAAMAKAIEAAEIEDTEAIIGLRTFATYDDGKMIYKVKFIYGDNEYEYEIDCKTLEILESECEPFEEPDIDDYIDEFIGEHGDELDKIFDEFEGELEGIFGDVDVDLEDIRDHFGKGEHNGFKDIIPEGEKPLTRGELLALVLERLSILEENVEETEIDMKHGKKGSVIEIELELKDGSEYEIFVEVCTGTVIRATLNGEAVEVPEAEVNTPSEEPAA